MYLCLVRDLSFHFSLTLAMFVCMLRAPLEIWDLSIHLCCFLEASSCFSSSAGWCKHFSVLGWHSSFVLLALHVSRIQLQFFTANKLSNDSVFFSCCKIICNLVAFSVTALVYNHSPDHLFGQLSTYGKPKSLQFL